MFILVRHNSVCGASVVLGERANLERYWKALHKNHESDCLAMSELRKQKVKDLRSGLEAEQTIFSRSTKQSKAATVESFKIIHILVKHKETFEDGRQ